VLSSMARVIVGLPFRHSRSHGQDRLRTIQRLNLTLLIHAQHQGFRSFLSAAGMLAS
jgi:hypothetical protein